MVDERWMCAECVGSTYSNTIDLCPDCIDKDVFRERDNVQHRRSHVVMKFYSTMFMWEQVRLMKRARLIVSQALPLFPPDAAPMVSQSSSGEDDSAKDITADETNDGAGAEAAQAPAEPEQPKSRFSCSECNTSLSLPCWFCLSCHGRPIFRAVVLFLTNPRKLLAMRLM